MKAKQSGISPIGILLLVCLAMTVLATSCKQCGSSPSNEQKSPTPTPTPISAKAKQIEAVILRGDLVGGAELAGLPLAELRILRNAVFARHGRQYDRPGLGDYFYNCDWYKPNPSYPADDSATNWQAILTANDKKNVETILPEEEKAKQPPTQAPSPEPTPTRSYTTPGGSSLGSLSTTLRIEYRYSPVAICEGARATLGGTLVGEAKLLELAKGQYFLVQETHYSPSSGNVIYEGLSKFTIAGGMKISEETISGQKRIEIFRSWPSGLRGF